jgi:hypothetical protein
MARSFAAQSISPGGSREAYLLLCARPETCQAFKRVPNFVSWPNTVLQDMKIERGVRPFAKMTGGDKGIIDPATLYLRAVKFITMP